jgi:hypothetical protein
VEEQARVSPVREEARKSAAVGMGASQAKSFIWIPGSLPGMNNVIAAAKGQGGRGWNYAALKKKWTNDIALIARASKVTPIVGPAWLDFTWREKDRRRNPDNIAAGRKFVLDGLVTAGVLAEDGWNQIAGWTDRWEVSQRPGVLIELRPAA